MRPCPPFLPAGLGLFLCALVSVFGASAAEVPAADQFVQPGTAWVQVAGHNQRVQPGTTFFLQVRLVDMTQGVHIGVGRVETSGPIISCDNDLTDGTGFA